MGLRSAEQQNQQQSPVCDSVSRRSPWTADGFDSEEDAADVGTQRHTHALCASIYIYFFLPAIHLSAVFSVLCLASYGNNHGKSPWLKMLTRDYVCEWDDWKQKPQEDDCVRVIWMLGGGARSWGCTIRGLDGREHQRVMNEWVTAGVWAGEGGSEGGREKCEGGAVTSVSLWQMCVLAWRRRDIKSLLIIFLFPELTGVSVPGGFFSCSERGADRCTPLVASTQDGLWCTPLLFFSFPRNIFFLHSVFLSSLFGFFPSFPFPHIACSRWPWCFSPHMFQSSHLFPFMIHIFPFIYRFFHPCPSFIFFFSPFLSSFLVFYCPVLHLAFIPLFSLPSLLASSLTSYLLYFYFYFPFLISFCSYLFSSLFCC